MKRGSARFIIIVLAIAALLWIWDRYAQTKMAGCTSGLYTANFCQAQGLHILFEMIIVLLVATAAWVATRQMAR
jgi:hypothetical protein